MSEPTAETAVCWRCRQTITRIADGGGWRNPFGFPYCPALPGDDPGAVTDHEPAGVFAMWRCGCTILERHSADIPTQCPEHEADAIYPNAFSGEHWQLCQLGPGEITYGRLDAEATDRLAKHRAVAEGVT